MKIFTLLNSNYLRLIHVRESYTYIVSFNTEYVQLFLTFFFISTHNFHSMKRYNPSANMYNVHVLVTMCGLEGCRANTFQPSPVEG